MTAAEEICGAMRRLEELGLNRGTSGNVSLRSHNGCLITPSGIAPHRLRPEHIVAMDAGGGTAKDGPGPSSEWRFHRDIYLARPDAAAIVHVHSIHATALACHARPIPAFHYMVAVAGGEDIRCAPYATFGSQDLSDAAVRALDGRHACLLANHGMIALGRDLGAAIALAVEVESLAEQYLKACSLGEPRHLDSCEMQRVIERFRHYGAQHGQS